MVSLIVHAVLGVAVIVLVIRLNPHIFSRPPGPALSRAELAYYAVGVASIPICWYFNAQFVAQYAVPDGNPIWGPGSWTEFITLGYTNPAASSASADYTIANVILLPLFTIIDGLRRGIRHPWLFFVASLFTSFAFAFAFYFATMERQRRHQQAEVAVN
ncbi:DUF2834 domain-containing protein [Mycolicibacterium sp. HK-90]|uniref:DUF2834 domain-containing protein n=1 Tax=Mycolicibacterium sp. HK-90 TaxID=3056937 RepID=UPI00265B5BC4|nr:DUF2834 domain-containing protein [Mycolicibacterium sp. HK-90]WKG02653.1 DUF2834 domain-containing protein [Mycolicibacterium sp. HK-90]